MDSSWFVLWYVSFAWTAGMHIYEPPGLFWSSLLFVFALFFSYLEQRRAGRQGAVMRTLVFPFLFGTVQILWFPFYKIAAARLHAEGVFAAGSAVVLRICGMKAVAEGSMIYIDGALGTTAVLSSWEKAGALYILLFLTAGFLNLYFKRTQGRQYLIFTGIVLSYALLRYSFLLALYTAYGLGGLYWELPITMLSFLPLILICTRVFCNLPPSASLPLLSRNGLKEEKKSFVIRFSLSFLPVFSLVAFFGLRDYGKEKTGRVLVDEYHSDWEWTTRAYDEEWFGERSGYNYYCFYELLDHFFEAERNTQPVDSETLKDTDVLIIKMPTKAFSEEEIGYMEDFVERGGGLYLIGDHTNVFGTGSNLNEIAERFGLYFNYDSTYELTEGNLSGYDAPRLLAHPLVLGLPHFLFATSDTLQAKWQAEEIMLGYGLNCAQADYSQDNFFPEHTEGPGNQFGYFLQCAGVYHKKGRVLAFTDSTVFSNFWMFMPGKPELLLKSVSWLNRENILPVAPRELMLVCILLSLMLNLAWILRRREGIGTLSRLTGGLSALLIAMCIFHMTSGAALAETRERKPMTRVCFEREYSQFAIPDCLEGFMTETPKRLDTFYVWTQRLGCYPSVSDSLKEAMKEAGGGLSVIIKPSKEFEDTRELLNLVSAGAKILILDHMASGGHSNSFLKELGMELKEEEMSEFADYKELQGIALSPDASAVLGGRPLIQDRNGNVILAVQDYGKGQVAVFSDPDLFYNHNLGDVSANLTPKTELLSRVEFQLLKDLLGFQR